MDHITTFKYTVNNDSIALITIDLPNEKVNKLSSKVMNELHTLIQELKLNKSLKGAIFISGKKGIFIAGADIKEIQQAQTNIEQGRKFLRDGHKIFNELTDLPFPTCVAIDGVCMGGGLEFALACDFRIAALNPKTILALPEVKLGIMPGWGGSQRLPRLVGLSHAVDIICSGRDVYTKEAYEIGLVNDYSNSENLVQTSINYINGAIKSSDWKKQREKLRKAIQISENEALSIFTLGRNYILKETKGHYPSPIQALEAIEIGYKLPLMDAMEVELKKIDSLLTSEISQNLIHLFFIKEKLKKKTWTETKDIIPNIIKEVGIIGAGIMGSGIATANIYKDIPVVIKDVNVDQLKKGVNESIRILSNYVQYKIITQTEMNNKLTLLNTTQHDGKLRDVDLLIEAVVEDVDTKIKVFTDIQSNLSESTIIASNTTSISINELSKHIKNKENFLGLHFFNPVDKMLLVEIIRSKYTSDKTILTAVNYARNIGKTPIVINDGVGFVTSRVLFPYLNEAVFLIEEGKDIELIDRVITSFGMPMGPITLLDVVGIDTAHSAGKILNTAFPDRFMQSPILKLLIDNNRLGQKSGMGFYLYSKKNKKGKRDENLSKLLKDIIVENKPSSENELTNRMILTMLLEAIRVLEDGVSTSVIDIDMAMILGIGFPTFRGGLLKYADSLGIKEILKLCDKFSLLGKRYEPPQLLINMAKQGKTFY